MTCKSCKHWRKTGYFGVTGKCDNKFSRYFKADVNEDDFCKQYQEKNFVNLTLIKNQAEFADLHEKNCQHFGSFGIGGYLAGSNEPFFTCNYCAAKYDRSIRYPGQETFFRGYLPSEWIDKEVKT